MDTSLPKRAVTNRRPPFQLDSGWTGQPAAPATPSPRGGAGPPAAAAPPVWRVLVVDDNEDAAAMLALLLEMSGHAARTAHDGPQALVAAEEFRPDAVLLDIGLPGFDGHEVARRLRQRPWGRDVLLLAVTGWDPDGPATADAGFDGHMVKPLDPDVLLKTLDQRLGRRARPGNETSETRGGDGG